MHRAFVTTVLIALCATPTFAQSLEQRVRALEASGRAKDARIRELEQRGAPGGATQDRQGRGLGDIGALDRDEFEDGLTHSEAPPPDRGRRPAGPAAG